MLKTKIIDILLLLVFISCNQKTIYLSNEEKTWNPYKEGQILIFESSKNYNDTIHIEALDLGFPDGLGVVEKNESLFVIANPYGSDLNQYISNKYAILTIVANTSKSESYVEHRIELKNTIMVGDQKFSFDELKSLTEMSMSTKYGLLDDKKQNGLL
jgi:hypothetical protein